jgi:hypothetical protein
MPTSAPSVTVVSVANPPDIDLSFPPDGDAGPFVTVRFLLMDPGSAMLDLEVRAIVGGQTIFATPAPTSDRLKNVPAPDVWADYRFVWNAGADVQSSPASARLEFTLFRAGVPVGSRSTAAFSVNTTPKMAASTLAPPPAVPIDAVIEIMSGNNQTGIGGQWLPAPITVIVKDRTTGHALDSARIYCVTGGTAASDAERDPQQSMVTDGGLAAFVKRARPVRAFSPATAPPPRRSRRPSSPSRPGPASAGGDR